MDHDAIHDAGVGVPDKLATLCVYQLPYGGCEGRNGLLPYLTLAPSSSVGRSFRRKRGSKKKRCLLSGRLGIPCVCHPALGVTIAVPQTRPEVEGVLRHTADMRKWVPDDVEGTHPH